MTVATIAYISANRDIESLLQTLGLNYYTKYLDDGDVEYWVDNDDDTTTDTLHAYGYIKYEELKYAKNNVEIYIFY